MDLENSRIVADVHFNRHTPQWAHLHFRNHLGTFVVLAPPYAHVSSIKCIFCWYREVDGMRSTTSIYGNAPLPMRFISIRVANTISATSVHPPPHLITCCRAHAVSQGISLCQTESHTKVEGHCQSFSAGSNIKNGYHTVLTSYSTPPTTHTCTGRCTYKLHWLLTCTTLSMIVWINLVIITSGFSNTSIV